MLRSKNSNLKESLEEAFNLALDLELQNLRNFSLKKHIQLAIKMAPVDPCHTYQFAEELRDLRRKEGYVISNKQLIALYEKVDNYADAKSKRNELLNDNNPKDTFILLSKLAKLLEDANSDKKIKDTEIKKQLNAACSVVRENIQNLRKDLREYMLSEVGNNFKNNDILFFKGSCSSQVPTRRKLVVGRAGSAGDVPTKKIRKTK